jgi:superfamily I DNA and RNA helicase
MKIEGSMKDKSLFYKSFDTNTEIDSFLDKLREYAISFTNGNSVYVINKPLGEKKYEYSYEKVFVILIPKHKVLFLNYGNNADAFTNYVEDFLDDLGHISDKYNYTKVLGRARNWRKEFIEVVEYNDIKNEEISELLKRYKLGTKENERKGEFLISLLTGSINDIKKTGVEYPETILEKIKRKIILFDGDQTRFIYDEPTKNRITIQGLAGTGKTELLLHKVKELYVKSEDVRIAFTCHNKILAENLRERIPEFFDFMKVDEQIKWKEKLWVMSGWGSKGAPDSGVYSYICDYYNLPFERFSYHTTFDSICKRALGYLQSISNFEPCFDYILIDESQDFTENFFSLCAKVTKNCLYVAGDIFQNVFESEIISEVNPDFLLNKCYRTDPRTLMCAHAIGMGLFEVGNRLRWLEDRAWEDCGYEINRTPDGFCDLSRKPLRRFEDITNANIKSIEIIPEKKEKYLDKILTIIKDLKIENPSIEPDDIGIMFLENTNANYFLANQLEVEISEMFNWDVNIGYETKEKKKGSLFISNRNNVKGLEFPFVICLMQGNLNTDLQTRNSVYMMLTRSFITSYFIIPDIDMKTVEQISKGINDVNEKGYLHLIEPDKAEKRRLNNAIINRGNIYKSQRDIVEEIMDQINVNKKDREKLHKMISILHKEELDKDKLYEIIRMNYSLMN